MPRKHLTIAKYAKLEGVKVSAIHQRVDRGTLKKIYIEGKPFVLPHTDKTIKKPRKNEKIQS